MTEIIWFCLACACLKPNFLDTLKLEALVAVITDYYLFIKALTGAAK